MVSGWDKAPDPDNDYTSRDWPVSHTIALVVFLVVFVAGYTYVSLWPW
jgi:hypothetical protein